MDIVLATGQTLTEASKVHKAAKEEKDPLKLQAELIKAAIEATVAGMGGQTQQSQQTVVQPVVVTPEMMAQATAAAVSALPAAAPPPAAAPAAPEPPKAAPVEAKPSPADTSSIMPAAQEEPTGGIDFKGESVEFTSLIQMGAEEKSNLAGADEASAQADVAESSVAAAAESPDQESAEAGEPQEEPAKASEPAPKKSTFNPMEHATVDESSPSLKLEEKDERTEMFAPMDVLDAANVMKNRELAEVDTRSMEIDRKDLASPTEIAEAPEDSQLSMEEAAEADRTKWRELKVEGDRTEVFSPVEAVKASTDSRRPMDAQTIPAKGEWLKDKPAPSAPGTAEGSSTSGLETATGGDATMVIARPKATEASSLSELANEGEATRFAGRPPVEEAPEKSGAIAAPEAATGGDRTVAVPFQGEEARPESLTPSPAQPERKIEAESEAKAPAIMPIPDEVPGAGAATAEQGVDLGDDLLEGATRIFTQPRAEDKTEHLIKEIRKEMKQKANAFLNIDMLMKKADRYTAKRNYYLARKALRHAQALGADEETVKAKLREIRKLEFPEGLYNTISSDRPERVDTSEVLERLEQEFDLVQAGDDEGAGSLAALVEGRIEAIFTESEPRTILDFGVALLEMGLYKQAEALLMRLVREVPDYAFDAYYLAAMAKQARRDYAGAASILKRLSSDTGKTDQEKIQIYYALGETFEKMQQPDRSRAFFRKVAELDSNYRNIRHKLEE
jgi:tetratricopeptide (TPR) repeat protein